MKVIVVGCGSIGQRHIRNLRALGASEIVACDPDRDRQELVTRRLGAVRSFSKLEEALKCEKELTAALICSPSSLHLIHARQAASAGLDLFVEKPLAHTLDGVGNLLAEVAARKRLLMVAMCYRFHPGLRELKRLVAEGVIGRVLAAEMWAGSYLPGWHPGRDYRKEYSARRDLGGGVILDSIHSIDTLRWLLGEPLEVACHAATVGELEIDTEDVAAIIAVMGDGAVVNLHVDYLQRPGSARVELVGSEGKAVWDAAKQSVDFYLPRGGWRKKPYCFEANDMYVAELRHFLDCLRQRTPPITDGGSGVRTLEVALAAKRASAERRFVRLGEVRLQESWKAAV